MKTYPLILIAFLFSLLAHAADEKAPLKTWKGILKTGIAAIGGETTGVILSTTKGARYELDFGKNAGLIKLADKLNGKLVSVIGKLQIRRGVEIRERQIIVVAEMKGLEEAVKPLKDIDVDDLCRHWVDSTEELQAGSKDLLFRPKDFKNVPPGHFRMEYKFARNGDCEWLFLDPADAHRFKSGKWKVDPNDKTALLITKGGKTESYKVKALTKVLLRMTPIESRDN